MGQYIIKGINRRYLVVGMAMLSAAGLALALTPRWRMADQGPKINLEAMIPKQFGNWGLDKTVAPLMVSPDVKALLDKVYNQTLTRTYVNNKGDQIMLAISFGDDQSRPMQVHRPEVCYVAQGFQIERMSKEHINADAIELPVMKLIATRGQRIEPIIYWIMIGDSAVRGHLEQFMARLKYGLTGKIPYGILIRVSTISMNESQAYRTEEQFVREMLSAIPAKSRKILAGPAL